MCCLVIVWCYQSNPTMIITLTLHCLSWIINLTPNLGVRLIILGAQKNKKGATWRKLILSGLMHKTNIVTFKH